jgi:hypothetical protein
MEALKIPPSLDRMASERSDRYVCHNPTRKINATAAAAPPAIDEPAIFTVTK